MAASSESYSPIAKEVSAPYRPRKRRTGLSKRTPLSKVATGIRRPFKKPPIRFKGGGAVAPGPYSTEPVRKYPLAKRYQGRNTKRPTRRY